MPFCFAGFAAAAMGTGGVLPLIGATAAGYSFMAPRNIGRASQSNPSDWPIDRTRASARHPPGSDLADCRARLLGRGHRADGTNRALWRCGGVMPPRVGSPRSLYWMGNGAPKGIELLFQP